MPFQIQIQVILLLCLVFPVSSLTGQVIKAVRLSPDEKITLDGRIDEPAWERAEPAKC